MSEFFGEYARIVIFFHVVFAIAWIGGMIVVRFAVHNAMSNITDTGVRLGTTLAILGKFFQMIVLSIVVMGITGIVMLKSIPFADMLVGVAHLKTQLWTLMAAVFGYIYFRFHKAKGAYAAGDMLECAKYLSPIPRYLILINISLGLLAVLFGVVLRGY